MARALCLFLTIWTLELQPLLCLAGVFRHPCPCEQRGCTPASGDACGKGHACEEDACAKLAPASPKARDESPLAPHPAVVFQQSALLPVCIPWAAPFTAPACRGCPPPGVQLPLLL